MCYSAMVWAEFHKFVREFGAVVDIREFARMYGQRKNDRRVKIPRAIDRNFTDATTEEERAVRALIDEFNSGEIGRWEAELFANEACITAE